MTEHNHSGFRFRSYDSEFYSHSHDYAQIVLPVLGTMDIEIERRGQKLDLCRGALVLPGSRHGQCASGRNRFLVVECHATEASDLDPTFAGAPYFQISPALRRLIDYIELSTRTGAWIDANTRLCLPLILAAIKEGSSRRSRLDTLRQQIESSIDQRWHISDMARVAGVSTSRLHSLFKTAYGQSPNRYLAALRLDQALRLLSGTDTPLSQVAQETGYSDQSALTRAMRKDLGVTPGKYRRRRQ